MGRLIDIDNANNFHASMKLVMHEATAKHIRQGAMQWIIGDKFKLRAQWYCNL